MATGIAVMHEGAVQQFADPDTVYNRPANLFVARFMGSPPMNTLPARLESANGGPVVVLGEGDQAIRLPAPSTVGAQWLGKQVVLGIRPECIAEARRQFGDGTSPGLTISAAVEMIEPTGAETIVVIRIGGEKALARVAPDMHPSPGQKASFAIDVRNLCLFDPTTELLIA